MNRRLMFLVLTAVCLLLAGAASAAAAAAFVPVRTYAGQFVDVKTSDWYYKNVKSLYELGLISGQSEDRFAPDSDMTAAEVVTMAARLRSLWDYGESETGPARFSGPEWYSPYAAYLRDLGVIDAAFITDGGRKITRAEMAHVLAGTLPASLFQPVNEELVAASFANLRYLPDLDGDTPYLEDILLLYDWGILVGTDEFGSFLPENPVSRSQVAAMVTRLVYEDLRLDLPWEYGDAVSCAGLTMADLVRSDRTFHAAPALEDSAAIDADVRRMLSRGERTLSLQYAPNTLNQAAVSKLRDAFLSAARGYVEQTYNAARCSYTSSTGELTMEFFSSLYGEDQVGRYRTATMEAAIQVHDQMWLSGAITADTSDYDTARIYYTWLCQHCRFDYDCTDDSMSHSGYQALYDGLAVCDGYTAAYNLLLKLEGIECSTASTIDHIWTVAVLDGETFHIDPTWGDMGSGEITYEYFAMSEKTAFARF